MAGSFSYDVAVIGAGIGGYVAAIRSAQLGKKVILIEKEKLGGACLNWGCIPTRALLATMDLLRKIKKSEDFGLRIENMTIDFDKILARKDTTVNRHFEGLNFLIKKNNIQLIKGEAAVLSKNQIHVRRSDGAEETTTTENMIIAAGSEEPKPSYAVVDEEKILTTKGALRLKKVPESLAVIGGNVIGIEFAQIFNALGSKVKVLEAASNVLPTLDKDLGRFYQRVLKKDGIEVYVDAKVNSVKAKPNGKVGLRVTSKGAEMDIETEKVLVTDGRRPLSSGLGLERIGVQIRDGFVVVDEHMRTSVPNIYAVGDIIGGKMFAHVAAAGGIVAAENIAGLKSTLDYKTIPTCMYSSPEVASVGLSEDEAKTQGYNVAVGRFPLTASGSASALGEEDGFAKVVCDGETGEILGVHLIAPNATEIISTAALAMRLECTNEELGSLICAHPTISEALMEAAKAVSKKAIHILEKIVKRVN